MNDNWSELNKVEISKAMVQLAILFSVGGGITALTLYLVSPGVFGSWNDPFWFDKLWLAMMAGGFFCMLVRLIIACFRFRGTYLRACVGITIWTAVGTVAFVTLQVRDIEYRSNLSYTFLSALRSIPEEDITKITISCNLHGKKEGSSVELTASSNAWTPFLSCLSKAQLIKTYRPSFTHEGAIKFEFASGKAFTSSWFTMERSKEDVIITHVLKGHSVEIGIPDIEQYIYKLLPSHQQRNTENSHQ